MMNDTLFKKDSWTIHFDRLNIIEEKDRLIHEVVSIENIRTDDVMDEDEYGFFESDEGNCDDSMTDTEYSTKSSSPEQSLLFSRLSKDKIVSYDLKVLYEQKDSVAPLACRSFERLGNSSSFMTYVSSEGFHIVENRNRTYAEYKIKLNINGKDFITYKSIDDLQIFADQCLSQSRFMNHIKNPFKETLKSWNEILKSRSFWWNNSTLDPQFLIKEQNLIKDFLINVLFEVPCIEVFQNIFC